MTKKQTTKKKKKIPSARQTNAAKAVVENLASDKPVSTGQVLKSVGYGTGLQHQPQRVLESAGFKQALSDMGLTEELITTSLVTDIENKEGRRLGELKLGAEMLGMVRKEETPMSGAKNTYNFIFSSEVQGKVKVINEEIKKLLTNPKNVQENQEGMDSQS